MLRSLRTSRKWWPAAVLVVCLALMANGYGDDSSQSTGGGTQAPTPKPKKEAPPPPPAPKCTNDATAKNKQTARELLENVSGSGDWDLDAEMKALDELWGQISGWCHLWHNGPNTAFGIGGLSDPAWNERWSKGRSDNSTLQIRIGLDYIHDTHRSPQAALNWWNCTENCKKKDETVPRKEKGAKAWY